MPKCIHCGKDITSFDYDICPHCGQKNPLGTYRTKDITTFVEPIEQDAKLRKSKSRLFFLFLGYSLGIFGLHWFYLGYKLRGFLNLLVTALVVAGIGSVLYFLVPVLANYAMAYWLLAILLFLINLFVMLSLTRSDDLLDRHGERLR